MSVHEPFLSPLLYLTHIKCLAATVGDSFIFGVNKEGILMAGWNDPSTGPNLSPVGGGIYGTEYQLASSLAESTSSATSPQTKVTLTTPNLPAGTYKVSAAWLCSHTSAQNSALFDVTLNGTPQGTRDTMEMELKDVSNIEPRSRIFYLSLSGVNTILLRYWNESNSTTISDATIELIRVS